MKREVFKNRIRLYRLREHITQRELALRCGVSQNTISAIENGDYNPSSSLAYKLCCWLNATFMDLFYFEYEEDENAV